MAREYESPQEIARRVGQSNMEAARRAELAAFQTERAAESAILAEQRLQARRSKIQPELARTVRNLALSTAAVLLDNGAQPAEPAITEDEKYFLDMFTRKKVLLAPTWRVHADDTFGPWEHGNFYEVQHKSHDRTRVLTLLDTAGVLHSAIELGAEGLRDMRGNDGEWWELVDSTAYSGLADDEQLAPLNEIDETADASEQDLISDWHGRFERLITDALTK